jgi:hypothetical protein
MVEMQFIKKHWLEIIMLGLLFIMLSWAIGYYANGLLGYHFELQSCWAGLSTIGSAGFLAAVKYFVDSWLNTERGEKPNDT